MFRRSSDPLALSEASLLALRPSMNAPVLNVDFLPIGPARAAIVVFAEEYGGIGLALGVRSEEGGQIAVFTNQEPIDASTRIVDALEPALKTAERMGFLFDDDLIESAPGGQGRSRAMALWDDLMGAIEEITSSGREPEDELLLDDIADVDLSEISLELDEELAPVAPRPAPAPQPAAARTAAKPEAAKPEAARPLPPSRPPLSKFRNETSGPVAPASAEEAEPPGDTTLGGSELGRIPLVRVKREGGKRAPFLARLLSSF